MRMMIQFSIPVEAGNQAARKGTLGAPFEKILAELKPEAAYFTATEHGERGGFILFDLKDTSQNSAILEPFFLMYKARLKISPVFNLADHVEGPHRIERASDAYGGEQFCRGQSH